MLSTCSQLRSAIASLLRISAVVVTLKIGLLLTTMSLGEYIDALPPFLDYYEPLNKFVVLTAPQVQSGVVRWQTMSFYAFMQEFNLRLEFKPDIFVPDAKLTIHWSQQKVTRQSIEDFTGHFVNGHLQNDNESYVIGSLDGANFEGIIFTGKEIYYVEPSFKHFNSSPKFKSIIFRASDINITKVLACDKKGHTGNSSGSDGKSECMRRRLGSTSISKRRGNRRWNGLLRTKKEVETPTGLHGANICLLKLVCDHTFFQFVTDHTTERTILEMRLIIAESSKIFKEIDFNANGMPDGFDFQVAAVDIVYAEDSPNYKMYRRDLAIDQFLSSFAESDYDEFCLAIAFTHRNFPSGILGYAFSGSPDLRRPGGICQKRRRSPKSPYPKSYNTMVITIINSDGEIMPRRVNGMNLCHEIGHAFGAPHDDLTDYECSPTAPKGGKYIMSPVSLTWNENNNMKFSRCSLEVMKKVLELKGGCLTSRKPICGNSDEVGDAASIVVPSALTLNQASYSTGCVLQTGKKLSLNAHRQLCEGSPGTLTKAVNNSLVVSVLVS